MDLHIAGATAHPAASVDGRELARVTQGAPIIIGLGANLPSRFGPAEATLTAALAALDRSGIAVRARSRFWRTAPVPVSDQPWFVNAVAVVETDLPPAEVLSRLHAIERDFGRVRGARNEARLLDLDLIAYGRVIETGALTLPHPRLAARAFVLLPLQEVAPDWVHPVTGKALSEMIAELPEKQHATPLPQLLPPLVRGEE